MEEKNQEPEVAPALSVDREFEERVYRMDPVVSSQISSIGYHPEDDKLAVEFKGGSVYRYDNVGAEMHKDLMAAESKGSFFIQFIKKFPDRFPYVRLRDTDKQEAEKASRA